MREVEKIVASCGLPGFRYVAFPPVSFPPPPARALRPPEPPPGISVAPQAAAASRPVLTEVGSAAPEPSLPRPRAGAARRTPRAAGRIALAAAGQEGSRACR